MQYIDILPIPQMHGCITLPGSKSISNRILLLAALAEGTTFIHHLLCAEDTQQMLTALQALGVQHSAVSRNVYQVKGCKGNFPIKNTSLFLGNSGTTFRMLTSILALMQGNYRLSGIKRMHERPIGDLVDALTYIGARIHYLDTLGCPPLHIEPAQIQFKEPIPIRGDVSSQFLTALLIALPLLKRPASIKIIGQLISAPYIKITLHIMHLFGVSIQQEGPYFHYLDHNSYQSPGKITVEADASSASYFLAAGAIKGGRITVQGIGQKSIQGDKHVANILAQMGAKITWEENSISITPPNTGGLKAIECDCNNFPDAAMTIAIAALFAQGTTTLNNIGSWRVKETDRLTAISTELRKVGAIVEEGSDYIRITPPEKLLPNAIIETYNDHRMAMCFSLVALGGVPIRINHPDCVVKTFPHYFTAFKKLAVF